MTIAIESLLVYLLIIVNIVVSVAAFRDSAKFERWAFEVDPVLIGKEYYRLISSAFVHVNILHLVFNMWALYSAGLVVARTFGPWDFLGIYCVSLLAAKLFALYIHRNHGDYSSVGASGAVSGVWFALIVLAPQMPVSFFLFPIAMPAWLFGIIYILVSIYGIKSQVGNIGHEAHLGGAVMGILLAVFLKPALLHTSFDVILLFLIPVVIFLVLIIKWPEYLLIDRFFRYHAVSSVERYKSRKEDDVRTELDRLLDKVAAHGLSGLSWIERRRLKKLSKKVDN